MGIEPQNKIAANPAEGGTALATNAAGTSALQLASDAASAEAQRDMRLDRLPMQLDVMVKVRSFRVEDLLALEQGSLVETVHEHSQDVPVRCGGALLVWAEFEVVEQKLAVRVTRLA
jgi:flagellar motor switch protein FliN/FliY